MKLWGLRLDDDSLAYVALRTRRDIQDWAGQRFMGADDYEANRGNYKALWRIIKRHHPDFRIVRVTVNGDGCL